MDPSEDEKKVHDNPVFVGDEVREGTYEKNCKKVALKTAEDSVNLPISRLFQFASRLDVFLISVSVACAIVNGICLPAEIVAFGIFINALVLKDLTTEELNSIRCHVTNVTTWTNHT